MSKHKTDNFCKYTCKTVIIKSCYLMTYPRIYCNPSNTSDLVSLNNLYTEIMLSDGYLILLRV